LAGHLAIPIQIGLLSARSLDRVFRRYDRLAQEGKEFVDVPDGKPRFAPGGRARLVAAREAMVAEGADPALVERLTAIVEEGDDLSLSRLRPYALADNWNSSRRALLELCLLATRAGLLSFRWDLLCPLCRVAKAKSATLATMPSRVHCDTCNIDYTVNFDRQVELVFRPNPAIRLVDEEMEFCAAGPQTTPHIVVQQLLSPGERRTVHVALSPGRYRLRALGLPGGQFFEAVAGGPEVARLRITPEGWPAGETGFSTRPELVVENGSDAERLLILERLAWTDQAATAAEVTVLQRFRDLFAGEALRPGEQISVGSLTVMFTDLRNSTQLYREIGDAPAFGLVMSHFDVLREAIVAGEGSIVKTIGDAVMAVFRRPAAAIQAIYQAQQRLAQPPGGGRPLLLKAGIHHGPCIAVTLNERLDYFGSTVNLAARLESLSTGGDTIISTAVYEDPEVAAWLTGAMVPVAAEPFLAQLKGFDDESFQLWRVQMANQPVSLPAGAPESGDPQNPMLPPA
jgi:class 3 adenylate cyclase